MSDPTLASNPMSAISYEEGSYSRQPKVLSSSNMKDSELISDEEAVFSEKRECRICQDEDYITKMEAPCACKGSLEFAHRECIQKWCNEKENITCEICNQPYQPDYTIPPPSSQPCYRRFEDFIVEISEGRVIPGTLREVNSSQALENIDADRPVEAQREEEDGNANSVASTCRKAALLFLTLLLLKDTFRTTSESKHQEEDDIFTMLYVILCFFVPCYATVFVIDYWKIYSQRRHHEPGRVSRTEISIVIESEAQNEGRVQRVEAESESEDCLPHVTNVMTNQSEEEINSHITENQRESLTPAQIINT